MYQSINQRADWNGKYFYELADEKWFKNKKIDDYWIKKCPSFLDRNQTEKFIFNYSHEQVYLTSDLHL